MFSVCDYSACFSVCVFIYNFSNKRNWSGWRQATPNILSKSVMILVAHSQGSCEIFCTCSMFLCYLAVIKYVLISPSTLQNVMSGNTAEILIEENILILDIKF